jgi:hypothetical protein
MRVNENIGLMIETKPKKPSDKTSPHCSVTCFYATGHSFNQTGAFDFQTDSCMLIGAYLHGLSACSHAP